MVCIFSPMATQSCPYYAERCIAIEAVKKSLGACIGPASGLPIKHIWTKSDGSQVTSMDYAVQVIISKVLTGADAGAEIIGEEDYGEICEDPSARKEICDLVNLAFPGSGPPADFNSVSCRCGQVRFIFSFNTGPINRLKIASLIRLGSQEKERGERFWVIDPIGKLLSSSSKAIINATVRLF